MRVKCGYSLLFSVRVDSNKQLQINLYAAAKNLGPALGTKPGIIMHLRGQSFPNIMQSNINHLTLIDDSDAFGGLSTMGLWIVSGWGAAC
jgi:hypothetical protein